MLTILLSVLVVGLIAVLAAIAYSQSITIRTIERDHNQQVQILQRGWLEAIRERDRRLDRADAEYKALVESYLRETGKVYIAAPKFDGNDRKLDPPQPNPWKMKPPPPPIIGRSNEAPVKVKEVR